MKIVCCNKYFFVNGGTEQYMFRLLRRLPRFGCQAAPFSVAYAGSHPSPYAAYFLPPPGDPGQTHYHTLSRGLGAVARLPRLVGRTVWSFEAKRYLHRLLDALGDVDLGYVLNICNYMSPSVIAAFKERGLPVVMQVGDYHLQCLNYQFLCRNQPCLRCAAGAYWNGVVRRCVKNSLPVSLARGASMYLHAWLRVYHKVDAFVVPCRFMRDRMVEGGYPEAKIHLVHQGVEPDVPLPGTEKGNFILYFGRLSPEKGLDLLLEAYQNLAPDVDLVLAGRGYDGYEDVLRRLVRSGFERRIRFVGFLQEPALSELVSRALLSVVPSRWYDNAPFSILESSLMATPVLAADIGGIPDLVENGVTGLLFTPGSATDLADKLGRLLTDRPALAAMGRAAREYALRQGSLDDHILRLLDVFRAVSSRPSPP